jgi:hypothetical protein
MRLSELAKQTPKTLYHGSQRQFPLGMILSPQSDGYVTGHGDDNAHQLTEQYIEKYRPANAIKRIDAVFACDNIDDIDNAGGYLDYVYTVAPIGKITICNLHWYSELYSYLCDDDIDEDIIKTHAVNYWNATPTPNAVYEYLANYFKVLELVEEN